LPQLTARADGAQAALQQLQASAAQLKADSERRGQHLAVCLAFTRAVQQPALEPGLRSFTVHCFYLCHQHLLSNPTCSTAPRVRAAIPQAQANHLQQLGADVADLRSQAAAAASELASTTETLTRGIAESEAASRQSAQALDARIDAARAAGEAAATVVRDAVAAEAEAIRDTLTKVQAAAAAASERTRGAVAAARAEAAAGAAAAARDAAEAVAGVAALGAEVATLRADLASSVANFKGGCYFLRSKQTLRSCTSWPPRYPHQPAVSRVALQRQHQSTHPFQPNPHRFAVTEEVLFLDLQARLDHLARHVDKTEARSLGVVGPASTGQSLGVSLLAYWDGTVPRWSCVRAPYGQPPGRFRAAAQVAAAHQASAASTAAARELASLEARVELSTREADERLAVAR
jgi:hypothetical protein